MNPIAGEAVSEMATMVPVDRQTKRPRELVVTPVQGKRKV